MGDYYHNVVATQVSDNEAPNVAARMIERLIAEEFILAEKTDCVIGADQGYPPGPAAKASYEWAGGVEVIVGRHLYTGSECDSEPACPRCGQTVGWKAFPITPTDWLDGDDDGRVSMCPLCKAMVDINEWRHVSTLGYGDVGPFIMIGCLGLVVWNWSEPLPQEFVAAIEDCAGPVMIGSETL
jgi:hypothetical protein